MRKSKNPENKIQYVIPVGNGWAIRRGDKKILLIIDSKREAVALAKERAKHYGHELVIYGKDSQIATRTDYSKKIRITGSKR